MLYYQPVLNPKKACGNQQTLVVQPTLRDFINGESGKAHFCAYATAIRRQIGGPARVGWPVLGVARGFVCTREGYWMPTRPVAFTLALIWHDFMGWFKPARLLLWPGKFTFRKVG